MRDADILGMTQERIEDRLGRAQHHPDVAYVVDLVRVALLAQRRLIAKRIRAEERAILRDPGRLSGRISLTFMGGLRHAARIAERAGGDD
jgi:hypothetical protein